jgi:hypothetical protein
MPIGELQGVAQAFGRAATTDITIAAEHAASGAVRSDVPVLATVHQSFRLAPQAQAGAIELRLTGEHSFVMHARDDAGRALRVAREGSRTLVERPAGMSRLTVTSAATSADPAALRMEFDRLHVGDLGARIHAGAQAVGPPAHFRTGQAQPDLQRVLLRFDQPGWELGESSLGRAGADYVHPLTETRQVSLEGPRSQPVGLTASYTGRVDGHAATGRIADARRGARRVVQGIGATAAHLHEAIGH